MKFLKGLIRLQNLASQKREGLQKLKQGLDSYLKQLKDKNISSKDAINQINTLQDDLQLQFRRLGELKSNIIELKGGIERMQRQLDNYADRILPAIMDSIDEIQITQLIERNMPSIENGLEKMIPTASTLDHLERIEQGNINKVIALMNNAKLNEKQAKRDIKK